MQMRDEVKAEFDAFLRDAGSEADWLKIEDDVNAMMPYLGRYADLTIVGQVDPDEILSRPEYEIPERVALESGRPALATPYAGRFATIGRNILIAWNGSPQSARAVNDAMPFLSRATKVTVLTINSQNLFRGKGDHPAGQIASHLSRYGLNAHIRELTVDNIAVDQCSSI
jgi:hypothetical protein